MENPKYKTVHVRVFRARGKASQFVCGCGNQAKDWAYDKSDPNPLIEDGKEYSKDVMKYLPLCRSCHRTLDRTATCRNGHPRTEENTKEYRNYLVCKICKREDQARYRREKR